MRTLSALILACLLPVVGSAQIPDNASLDGKYYFVHLLAVVSGTTGAASAQNLGGCMLFYSNGGFTFDGELGTGSGAPESASGAGTYFVDANAFVTLTNPICRHARDQRSPGSQQRGIAGCLNRSVRRIL